eukprot:12407861-Alexandrium_andersonii.AAC.1
MCIRDSSTPLPRSSNCMIHWARTHWCSLGAHRVYPTMSHTRCPGSCTRDQGIFHGTRISGEIIRASARREVLSPSAAAHC